MSTVGAEGRQASPLIWLTSMTAIAQWEQAECLTIPLNTPNFTLLSVQYWPMPSRICCSCSRPVVALLGHREMFDLRPHRGPKRTCDEIALTKSRVYEYTPSARHRTSPLLTRLALTIY